MSRKSAVSGAGRYLARAGLLLSLLALTVAAVPTQGAVPGSLPAVASGARPGPDVLYAPPPAAPALENRSSRFRAAPLLVSGTEAYADGEYLYQDYLYDDNGSATGNSDAGTSDTGGDVEYPTDRARYGGNAADLVELRISAGSDSVAYRFTLNTLLQADSTIVSLTFDTDRQAATGRSTLPRDPGFSFPGTDEVITAWGTGAEHTALPTSGSSVTTAVDVSADLEANQVTVIVPRTVSNPSTVWKATVAVGLYDKAGGGWLRPTTQESATVPGGAGPLDPQPSGVFNLGFRFDEVPAGLTPHDSKQAAAIRAKSPGAYQRDIDFAALAARANKTTVPATGTMVRIFPSRLNLGEGKDYSKTPELLGQLQAYSLYVPKGYDLAKPAGFSLNLHSLGEHHWQYNSSLGVQQIGEARANLVATPEARGEDGWYQNEAEFDVFEVWNDVARRYSLDPDRAISAGYSMGGMGTYRLATLYPDLFGRAFTTVGPPADGIWVPPLPATGGTETLSNVWLENARNVPFLNVVAGEDELVPLPGPRAQNMGAPELSVRGFDQLGYRFRFVVYPTAEHLTLAVLKYDLPYAVDFLGDGRVDRNPAHVTFSYAPATDDPKLALIHDHAYWVSAVRLADAASGTPLPKGTVDAFSHATGLGDPLSTSGSGSGTVPLPYVEVNRSWGAAPSIPKENKLTLKLTNVGNATLDLARAGIDPARPVTIVSDATHSGVVTLLGSFPADPTISRDGVVSSAAAGRSSIALRVEAGRHVYVIDAAGAGGSGVVAGAASRGRSLPATGPSAVAGPAGLLLLGLAVLARRLRGV